MPDGLRNDPRGEEPGRPEHERHVEGCLVGEDPVRDLVVVPQGFSVVGGQHHERPPRGASSEDRLEERTERGVGGGHRSLVGVLREARGEGLGRSVRPVGLVEVYPAEVRSFALGLDEAPRRRDRVHSPPPRDVLEPHGGPARLAEAVVVHVEAAGETEARVQGKGAHERPRTVPAGVEEGRDRLGPGGKAEARVVAHAVPQGVASGEDVRVGGERHHVVGVGPPEEHALFGQAVHPRRPRVGVPVRPDRVGPQGVDGDQEYVRASLATDRSVAQGEHGDRGRCQAESQDGRPSRPPPASACLARRFVRDSLRVAERASLSCHWRPDYTKACEDRPPTPWMYGAVDAGKSMGGSPFR